MADDYEDTFDLDDLSDQELQELVRAQLDDYDTIDADNILVKVKNGEVRLSGRVGTVSEREIADHILSDVIGLTNYQNDLFVDEIRRDEEPEAADDAIADAQARGEDQLGGDADMTTDPAALREEDDLSADLYGTHDVQRAIEQGTPYEPPDTPTPESGEDRP
jgi:hypothetical protein